MFSSNFPAYSGDGKTVTLQEFAQFLRKEQAQSDSLDTVASIMRDFLQVRAKYCIVQASPTVARIRPPRIDRILGSRPPRIDQIPGSEP